MTNKKIEFGDYNIPEEDFASPDAKVRISLVMPEDLRIALKEIASEREMKYQPLIIQVLRDFIRSERDNAYEEASRAIQRLLGTGESKEALQKLFSQVESQVESEGGHQ